MAVIGAFLAFAIYKVAKAAKKKTTMLEFVGQDAMAIDEISPEKEGFVRFHGEHWKAQSDSAITPGQKVMIISREGLILTVKPIKEAK